MPIQLALLQSIFHPLTPSVVATPTLSTLLYRPRPPVRPFDCPTVVTTAHIRNAGVLGAGVPKGNGCTIWNGSSSSRSICRPRPRQLNSTTCLVLRCCATTHPSLPFTATHMHPIVVHRVHATIPQPAPVFANVHSMSHGAKCRRNASPRGKNEGSGAYCVDRESNPGLADVILSRKELRSFLF